MISIVTFFLKNEGHANKCNKFSINSLIKSKHHCQTRKYEMLMKIMKIYKQVQHMSPRASTLLDVDYFVTSYYHV
jgi:hypothetical protein